MSEILFSKKQGKKEIEKKKKDVGNGEFWFQFNYMQL